MYITVYVWKKVCISTLLRTLCNTIFDLGVFIVPYSDWRWRYYSPLPCPFLAPPYEPELSDSRGCDFLGECFQRHNRDSACFCFSYPFFLDCVDLLI